MMTLPVVFNKTARAEVTAATRWYNERRSGLGRQFIASLDQVVRAIQSSPEMFPIDQGEYRIAPLDRFAYGVIYRIDAKQISVVAVYHLHREPRQWSDE